ncbi:type IV pilus assembly protein FimV [Thioalkalivibrio paradoxus]|uniref:Tetratricopeptide repeat protein n=1 Tax=Thioalkalivibrio paradoxus ARh 1 TaxID=713585 RepID=W0DFC6_9GAMM|nr:hypothetical protein [Thioalkalivibrio paradoxus]AHE97066.1 hypothetical protein THITH_00870 [Thioalkalivibrio paradoxus ARh 1]
MWGGLLIEGLVVDDEVSQAMMDVRVPVNFLVDGTKTLYLRGLPDPGEAMVLLEHRVLENPRDLFSHVRRVLLAIDQGDAFALEGALTDLFIVLGGNGIALKELLLYLVESRFPESLAEHFRRHLEAGFEPWDAAVAQTDASVLSLGFSGMHDLVIQGEPDAASGFSSALEEARSCLEYGQVDAARDVLEWALKQDPTDEHLATELLEIYTYTRDTQRREAMREFLELHRPNLPEGWYA